MSLAHINWRSLLGRFGLLLALGLLMLVLSLLTDRFMTSGNLLNILRQVSVNAVIAAGMTVVIITAGIDLSVGSILGLTGVIAATVALAGIDAGFVIAVILLAGAALGVFNGFFVGYVRLAPFIVTLAGLTIFRGLALAITDGRPISGLPPFFMQIGHGYLLGVPIPVWLMLGFILITHLLLTRTTLGRSFYAVGGNIEAARLSGIRVRRVLLLAYAYSGVAAALAALILTGRLNSAQPNSGTGYELDAIAAVVVGGTSLAGGRGAVFGTLVGAMIIGVLNNGMNLLNVPSFYQQVLKGGVILGAVLIERVLSRRRTA